MSVTSMPHPSYDQRQSLIGLMISFSMQTLPPPSWQCTDDSTSVCIPATVVYPVQANLITCSCSVYMRAGVSRNTNSHKSIVGATVTLTVVTTIACTVPTVALTILPCIHHVTFVFDAISQRWRVG